MGPLTHTIPIRIPTDMGIVWEAYHKGVPLLGVPGITLEIIMTPVLKGLAVHRALQMKKKQGFDKKQV